MVDAHLIIEHNLRLGNILEDLDKEIGGVEGVINAHRLVTQNNPEMSFDVARAFMVSVKFGQRWKYLPELERLQKGYFELIGCVNNEDIYNFIYGKKWGQYKKGLLGFEKFMGSDERLINQNYDGLKGNSSKAYDLFLKQNEIKIRKPKVEKFVSQPQIIALNEYHKVVGSYLL